MNESHHKPSNGVPADPVERGALTRSLRHPLETLRREIDRVFDDFDPAARLSAIRRSLLDVEPFWHRDGNGASAPAVDLSETEQAYEITAELPGMNKRDIAVTLASGGLSIRGEKQEDKEEKNKDYYMRERRFGTFERYFPMPEGVDLDKIAASFDKGVLKVTLPKTAEACRAAKRIEIKAG
ncbi:Hsp20/alpha crystallin family protein [Burkholderia glumae]|uniref:Hsp20/alpha crystallin family protein n=1 Tax=Burkholderia glumae TaxID=337 RepID=A0AAQ0BR84_BURGL|nr:Hsp20/alpha crystallin family protein [Burkholderia glumae]ACR32365.1 HSP20 family heat shock protein [Burkholderia glumae BGR1]AJY63886.1 hsp20/alpha crystallin family protein [Burkholderia glumae LMG 2196 = ATCC 33617]KHJ60326.1 molecular chaperone Hsp20 [Burkholderia glumae]MCM2484438.1 Hsp20/alpha crystallin family protein [Burkholderia glumae]MCM2494808.1 Hsp20/alpha crystallin family protein [Burkholderia glumae]